MHELSGSAESVKSLKFYPVFFRMRMAAGQSRYSSNIAMRDLHFHIIPSYMNNSQIIRVIRGLLPPKVERLV